MAINFAAASTAGLNNPGTEIITLVKDGSGNFINPPSYDKMRAYLSSGEVPMLFVTAEGGETGSLYQLVEYSETENKIRFSNSANAVEFCAGCDAPVVSDVGGGASSADVFIIHATPNAAFTNAQLDKTPEQIYEAYQSGKYCLADISGVFLPVTTFETRDTRYMMICSGFQFPKNEHVSVVMLEFATADGVTWETRPLTPTLYNVSCDGLQIPGPGSQLYIISVDSNGNVIATAT